ncbi:MAG: hemerythrin domain-containing protein [Bacteroidales bacterium]|nr:hemerythrin domain-containing protein [Bacteroidales bacterium]
MSKIGKYTESDSMSDLINCNYSILFVISRFGIGLGFGDKTIKEVCDENDIDTNTFLIIVNMLINKESGDVSIDPTISIQTILNYLHNSHKYFLQFKLPNIRRMLKASLGDRDSNVSIVIMKFYDEYVMGVSRHMQYEEKYVFPYIKDLISGEDAKGYNIDVFRKQHDNVEAKLSELKNIIIKYCSVETNDELISVLFDIFTCAEDLSYHKVIEDKLLVPVIERLEKSSK